MAKLSAYKQGSSFNVDYSKRSWIKLEDIYNSPAYNEQEVHQIYGLFINEKGKYGKRPYVATDIHLIDLPQHMTPVIEQMLQDPEVIQQINEGKAGFTVRAYMSNNYQRECYAITFVDIK